MFVSYDIVYPLRFLYPRKPRNKDSNSINKSKGKKLLLPRINKTVPVDTVIQEMPDEDGMLEDFTIK